MASVATAAAASTIACAATVLKMAASLSSSPVLGLLQIGVRGGMVKCSASEKAATAPVSVGVTLLATAASMTSGRNPALALADERMSTEATDLSLGLSGNLLGWILLSVFGLTWGLFFVYTSTLEEDEESGLSL